MGALGLACAEESSQAPAPAPESTGPAAAGAGTDPGALRERAASILGSLPDEAAGSANPVTPEKIALGRLLYYDARLSKNHDLSCNSCHDLDRAGADAGPTSVGHRGQRGNRNAPSVFNAALHVAQFWDGRAPDVEAQARDSVLNPIEMAMPSEQALLAVLRSIPDYAPLFRAAFPDSADPITYDNMARAIGAFERRLLTPSPFDAFVEGQDSALTAEEIAGLGLFLDVGCTSCHQGATAGGRLFQKLGVVKPYPTRDPGRAEVTGEARDQGVFKVPSLRNVAATAPYFHDGGVATLAEAVRLMARHQLGRELDDAQVASIVVFLETLTGKIDPEYVARPELPASGPDTPAPDPS